MDKKLINQNIINQINNQSLYEPSLLEFLLLNSDLNQLKSQTYEAAYINGVYFKSNFEGFLFSKFFYLENPKMKEQIYNFYKGKLEEPIYQVDIDYKIPHKNLSKNVFLLFRNDFENHLSKIHDKKEPSLNSEEEKFFINYILHKGIHLFKASEEVKIELYNILLNQKDYLQFKNSKSQSDIFLKNEHLKKVLDLYPNDKVDQIRGKRESSDYLIQTYFKKLYKSKVFDLHLKIKDREQEEIINSMESVLGKEAGLNWYKPLIKYGTNCGLEFFEQVYSEGKVKKSLLALNTRGLSGDRHPKAIVEMLNLIKSTKEYSKLQNSEDDISKLFLIVIYNNRKDIYLKLREMFEIPENIYASLMELQIEKTSIKTIESEVLNNKLEKELFSENHTHKRPKI